jgi:hypothetical protein
VFELGVLGVMRLDRLGMVKLGALLRLGVLAMLGVLGVVRIDAVEGGGIMLISEACRSA